MVERAPRLVEADGAGRRRRRRQQDQRQLDRWRSSGRPTSRSRQLLERDRCVRGRGCCPGSRRSRARPGSRRRTRRNAHRPATAARPSATRRRTPVPVPVASACEKVPARLWPVRLVLLRDLGGRRHQGQQLRGRRPSPPRPARGRACGVVEMRPRLLVERGHRRRKQRAPRARRGRSIQSDDRRARRSRLDQRRRPPVRHLGRRRPASRGPYRREGRRASCRRASSRESPPR